MTAARLDSNPRTHRGNAYSIHWFLCHANPHPFIPWSGHLLLLDILKAPGSKVLAVSCQQQREPILYQKRSSSSLYYKAEGTRTVAVCHTVRPHRQGSNLPRTSPLLEIHAPLRAHKHRVTLQKPQAARWGSWGFGALAARCITCCHLPHPGFVPSLTASRPSLSYGASADQLCHGKCDESHQRQQNAGGRPAGQSPAAAVVDACPIACSGPLSLAERRGWHLPDPLLPVLLLSNLSKSAMDSSLPHQTRCVSDG